MKFCLKLTVRISSKLNIAFIFCVVSILLLDSGKFPFILIRTRNSLLKFRPEEVLAPVIAKAASSFAKHTNNVYPTKIVLSNPAYFFNPQRRGIHLAAYIAGNVNLEFCG